MLTEEELQTIEQRCNAAMDGELLLPRVVASSQWASEEELAQIEPLPIPLSPATIDFIRNAKRDIPKLITAYREALAQPTVDDAIAKIKELQVVWDTAAKQRGSAFSDRSLTASQIIRELEALSRSGSND